MTPSANHDVYQSPLIARNASAEMAALFSPRERILTWRRLWLALAQAQRELGLPITAKQISSLKRALPNIDFRRAARYEKKFRHDVMAHVYTFGDAAQGTKGIIHLGATSAFVVDNADLIIMRQAAELIRSWLVNIIDALAKFAYKYRRMATLGLTHCQPAQLTTVGKRATLWCQDFIMDFSRLEFELSELKFRGTRGATGTQASYLALFDGRPSKARKLDRLVAEKMGFAHSYPVVGQTYPRKVDAAMVAVLAAIAASVHKFCNDIRLLASRGEIEEPFQDKQIGSSAMAYKRNPMRCERATGLARFVLSLASSPALTAAEQWFERTLDDSANKRLSIPEAFLATDGMLMLVLDVVRGLVVYPKIIDAHVRRELPVMATENILMAAAKAGGDRQALHERIRKHARAAAEQIKQGRPDDLLQRLEEDDAFKDLNIRSMLDPQAFVGLAPEQTERFTKQQVQPIVEMHRRCLRKKTFINV